MSTTLKWGLITGMVYVIFSLISNIMGIQQSGGAMGWLFFLLSLVGSFTTIFLGIKETRDQDLGSYLTFGQGFMTGFKIALIASVISAIFTLIYTKFIDPDFAEKMMVGVEAQWDKAGMPEENREMARKWTSYMFNPLIMSAMSLLISIFWGVIQSLIAGAILKKDPPPTAMPVV